VTRLGSERTRERSGGLELEELCRSAQAHERMPVAFFGMSPAAGAGENPGAQPVGLKGMRGARKPTRALVDTG
jgi:hypothetical protein